MAQVVVQGGPDEASARSRPRAGRTRDAIVDLAIRLFNERGASSVTTNHIAAEMGISPGNLYYHFRNKEEIVRAAYARFGAEAEAMLDRPILEGLAGPQSLRAYTAATFDLLSRWRFFYEDMADLCRRDADLGEEMKQLQRRYVGHLVETLARLRDATVLAPGTSDRELQLLADNIWLVSRGFVEFARNAARDPLPSDRLMRQGVAHIFALVRPHLSADARATLDESLAGEPG